MNTAIAVLGFFFVADLVYTLDHYLVHHDSERYRRRHRRHHCRYQGPKSAAQLDAYELSTYSRAGAISIAITGVLSLLSGNWGFLLGAALKYAHSLLFHLYQHRWWSVAPAQKLQISTPRRGWGIASAAYHAHHHARPDDELFTYAESWQGFDRILEWAHPVLVRYTADGRKSLHPAAAGRRAP